LPIYFAYDGSINNDWVFRYALRLASHDRENTLHLIHVSDGSLTPEDIKSKLDRLELEGALTGISLQNEILDQSGGIMESLAAHIPPGPETLLICGVRVKGHKKGHFSGTVSERLMKLGRWDVMALRILQPGFLGFPANILLPLSGALEGFHASLPFLNRLAPDIRELHLLRVMEVSHRSFRNLDEAETLALRAEGAAYLKEIEKELTSNISLDPDRIEAVTRISDDWVKEILIHAGRYKSGLILMEVPRKSLRQRFLFGDKTEELLRNAPCDVAIYRGVA